MASSSLQSSTFRRATRLCIKELREILRDRRTIITLVLMPILVYPLLAVIFQRIMLTMAPAVGQTTEVAVGVDSLADAQDLDDLISQYRQLQGGGASESDLPEPSSPTPKLPGLPLPTAAATSNVQFKYYRADEIAAELGGDMNDALADGSIQLVVRRRNYRSAATQAFDAMQAGSFAAGMSPLLQVTRAVIADRSEAELAGARFPANRPAAVFAVQFDPASPGGRAGAKFLEQAFEQLNRRSYQYRLEQAQLPAGESVVLIKEPIKEVEATTAGAFSTLVPLILILMTIAGGVYPAIDLTAGERERGTLEMLAAAPVPRIAILAGKYVAVVTVAVLTALVNLLGMAVTLAFTGMGALVLGSGGFSFVVILELFGLLVLFASFFSAVLLALTSFARSFKEAQAYLIPLMLFSLAPGLLALTPGLRLSIPFAITPLINMVLLARDVIAQNVEPLPAVVAVTATLIYAAAAVSLAASVFGADAVLYGGSGSWADIFRRPTESQPAASPSNALFCLAVLFPSFFLISSGLGQLSSASMMQRIITGAAVTVLLFVLLPAIAMYMGRVRWSSGFQLWLPRRLVNFGPSGGDPYITSEPTIAFGPMRTIAIFVGAALLGLSLWPLAHELVILSLWFSPSMIDESKFQLVLEMLELWGQLPLPLILLCMAVAPAVCEELFFRGYLFAAFRRRLNAWQTVLLTSVLFGLFHVVTSAALAPERFLPSAFLGLCLGAIAWKTRSVLPGMLLHVLHNGLLLSMAYYRDELAAAGWGVEEAGAASLGAGQVAHLPATWLVLSICISIAAGVLIGFASWRSQRVDLPASDPIAET